MDRILHSSDIKHHLERELTKTSQEAVIISAFVKLDALKFIDKLLPMTVNQKTLLVRFRLEDILSGSTDMDIYEFCQSNNWRVLINFDLHSKVFVFDRSRVIIGSANATSSGLGLKSNQNIESIVKIDATENEIKKIRNLIELSKELDQVNFEKMRKRVLELKLPSKRSYYNWEDEIYEHFETKSEFLWTADMFFSHSPKDICEHDREILELNEFFTLSDIRRQFIRSKPYRWLKEAAGKEIYFGELTAKLHDALMDDPKPYRRNVKILLSDLLNWFEELNIEEIVVDRPNHSQRIRVIS